MSFVHPRLRSLKQFMRCIGKKLNGVILKIDFEKAYDKVKWSFLQQTLGMKGFSDEWRALINNFVFDGSVAIKVNEDIGRYFQTKKGLRQGHPLSPMFFNIVTDMLAIITERAKVDGQIGGYLFFGIPMIQFYSWIMTWKKHET